MAACSIAFSSIWLLSGFSLIYTPPLPKWRVLRTPPPPRHDTGLERAPALLPQKGARTNSPQHKPPLPIPGFFWPEVAEAHPPSFTLSGTFSPSRAAVPSSSSFRLAVWISLPLACRVKGAASWRVPNVCWLL